MLGSDSLAITSAVLQINAGRTGFTAEILIPDYHRWAVPSSQVSTTAGDGSHPEWL